MKTKILLLAAVFLLSLVICYPVSAANNTVNLYLHKDTSVTTVNTIATDGQALNTTVLWAGGTQENTSGALTAGLSWSCYFYLSPTLATTLTLNGVPSVVLYLKANDTVTDLTFITTINKISAAGARTQISTKSTGSTSLTSSYAAKTNTHTTVSATVASGFTLELNMTIGASASDLEITLGFDTATYPSKVSLVATDPLTAALSSDKTIYEWEDSGILTSTVTDVWGGYDISSAPTITFTSPTGLSYTTSASSTGEAQLTNTYTYSMGVLNGIGGPGTWTATTSVSDRSGNSYISSSYTFTLKTLSGGVSDDTPSPTALADMDPAVVAVVLIIVVVAGAYFLSKKKK